jgi:hypothetical protein
MGRERRGDHVRRAVTHPLKGHIDQRVIVCLQHDAQIQLQDAVERALVLRERSSA